MAKWNINILDFNGGLAPGAFRETYPSYGNKNMAGAMQNCDLTNPNSITQGAGLATLTDGTQATAVTTLIKGILKRATSSNVSFGVGGNKLYKFSATAVSVASPFNVSGGGYVIDKATVTGELGEDVAEYNGVLYFSYNHSGSAGDIGTYDLNTTFDVDWGSTVPTGAAALTSAPHQLCAAGNDTLYIANGRYVAEWNGTTFVAQSLDLPASSIISSIAWSGNRLWIAANKPNLTGANNNTSSIYSWDGNATSWDDEIIVGGLVSALYVKNGNIFVWYSDISSTGGYKLGYINGTSITDLANFTGALPDYYQVSEYQDYLIWNSNGLIFAWGSGGKDLTTKLFQIADGGFSTVGGISCPFGTPIIASNETTSYKLAKFSGYDTACNWKSLLFDITNDGTMPMIEGIGISIEPMAVSASCAVTLKDNKGTSLFTDTISYTLLNTDTYLYRPMKVGTKNFRVELDWTNGNATNPVKIKNIKLKGTS